MTGLLETVAGMATGQLWKYATIGIGALSLVGIGAVGIDDYFAHRESAKYEKQVNSLLQQKALDGASITALKASLDALNAQIDANSTIGKAKLAAASEQVDAYRSQNASLQKRVATLLNKPLVGATPCARMDDADARVMGDLK